MADRLSSGKAASFCQYLRSQGSSPKEFLHTFLYSADENLAKSRDPWSYDNNLTSTASLLPGIRALFLKSKAGRSTWRQFVLDEVSSYIYSLLTFSCELPSSLGYRSTLQAQVYVNDENLPCGYAPKGGFHSSKEIDESFFDPISDEGHHNLVQEHMSFLYSIIRTKLDFHYKLKDQSNLSKGRLSTRFILDANDEENGLDAGEPDIDPNNLAGDIMMGGGVLALGDLAETRAHKLKEVSRISFPKYLDVHFFNLYYLFEQIPYTVCSMVAFSCNRRHNALQLHNSLTFVACGVSDRVNDYLNSIGLSSGRHTASRAFDTLQAKAEIKIRKEMARDHIIRPFLCADNLDFQTRVHHKQVDTFTRLFHGSWAYFHFIPSPVTPPALRGAWSLENFLKSMRDGASLSVSLNSFLPTSFESSHWVSTIKSQLSKALMEYIVKPLLKDLTKSKPDLSLNPPPIEPIKLYQPKILMLRLMDASDNSAEGVGQIIEQICRQISFSPEKFAEELQVFEGDVGTCLNIESLRNKRHPASNDSESLRNVLSVPGAAHTLWNFAEWIFDLHYGVEKDARDTGTWRTWHALGGTGSRNTGKKDFNTTMVMIHKVHSANLVFCLE